MQSYTLKHWVEEQGGVKRVAKKLSVTTVNVNRWVRGAGAPKLKTLFKIADYSYGMLEVREIARYTTRKLKGRERLC